MRRDTKSAAGALKRAGLGGLAAVLVGLVLAACGGSSGSGPVTLNWYVFPEPSGSFAAAAQECSQNSHGAYNIKISFLSTSSDLQRVSLVRSLAARDSSIDSRIRQGDDAELWFNGEHLHLFDPGSGGSLLGAWNRTGNGAVRQPPSVGGTTAHGAPAEQAQDPGTAGQASPQNPGA